MEIKSYRYKLVITPATSSVSSIIIEPTDVENDDGNLFSTRNIKRKDMKELVFQSMLLGHAFMKQGEEMGVQSIYVLDNNDIQIMRDDLSDDVIDNAYREALQQKINKTT